MAWMISWDAARLRRAKALTERDAVCATHMARLREQALGLVRSMLAQFGGSHALHHVHSTTAPHLAQSIKTEADGTRGRQGIFEGVRQRGSWSCVEAMPWHMPRASQITPALALSFIHSLIADG